MNARESILKILENFERYSSSLDNTIDKVFSFQAMDQRDKRLVVEIVYGILRNKLHIDFILEHFLNDKSFIRNKHLMRILRIGVYQIVYLDRIPDHAAVNESVSLAKSNRETKNFTGVINAVLRNIIKSKEHLPKPPESEDLLFRLSTVFSHPQWLVKRWLHNFGLSKTKKLLEFNNNRPDIYIRRRIRGVSRQQFEAEIKTVTDSGNAGGGFNNLYYRLKKNTLPENLSVLKQGLCTVQSESSGWAVALLDIKEGDKLLDICSAPGGKATLMSELAGRNGAVCACDLRLPRLMKERENVLRMNLPNVYMIVCNGEKMPFNGKFDKVLLDVPCSGSGVMHRHPDARWIKKEEDIRRLTDIQRNLLNGVAPFVVDKGILVYATCSLEPEENQLQVENFLKQHPEFVLEEPSGIIKDVFIDKNNFLYITPFEHKMDGMFAARMRKIAG